MVLWILGLLLLLPVALHAGDGDGMGEYGTLYTENYCQKKMNMEFQGYLGSGDQYPTYPELQPMNNCQLLCCEFYEEYMENCPKVADLYDKMKDYLGESIFEEPVFPKCKESKIEPYLNACLKKYSYPNYDKYSAMCEQDAADPSGEDPAEDAVDSDSEASEAEAKEEEHTPPTLAEVTDWLEQKYLELANEAIKKGVDDTKLDACLSFFHGKKTTCQYETMSCLDGNGCGGGGPIALGCTVAGAENYFCKYDYPLPSEKPNTCLLMQCPNDYPRKCDPTSQLLCKTGYSNCAQSALTQFGKCLRP